MRPLFLALLLLVTVSPAWGHPMPSSAVVLRLHRGGIDAELTLPIVELALGWEKPLPMDAVQTVRQYGAELEEYVRAHVRPSAPDGRPWTVTVRELIPVVEKEPDVRVSLTMTPPPGAPAERLTFGYDAIFHHLITHTALVTLASDWHNGVMDEEPVLLGTMRDTNAAIDIDRSGGSWFRGFAAMFRLGTRHIAEGTDHLLFLLALILPAPLVAVGGRWGGYAGAGTALRRIVKVVTAFTLGHSATLVIGAMGWARLPGAVVESAIALSILVSAIHALVPIFRGREIFIAGGFGLVHGLAFASTLSGFGLDPLTLASSVLGFNLGIEAFQLLVILAAMPGLVLLARSRAYGPFRIAGAALTGIAAAAWFFERALGWANPVAPLVESVASHALWLLAGLLVLTAAATFPKSLAARLIRPAERATEG
ncbi:MAG: HupE/UreJ family protein [Isosphaeraceae bacterium]